MPLVSKDRLCATSMLKHNDTPGEGDIHQKQALSQEAKANMVKSSLNMLRSLRTETCSMLTKGRAVL